VKEPEMTVRRLRGVMNSTGIGMSDSKRTHPFNGAFIHPLDLAEQGLVEGDIVAIESEVGRIDAIAQTDAALRRGVIAISHCWGGLPDENLRYEDVGVSTNLLVRTDRRVEKINAMPQMTAIPVRITAAAARH
jgi:anaerobic selenocysteine-containing dehydrogenase